MATRRKTKRRPRRVVVAEPEPVEELEEEELEEEELEEEEEVVVVKPAPRRRKKAVATAPEPEPEPEPEMAEVTDLDVFYGLLENLDDGAMLTITRVGEDTWTVSTGGAVVMEPAVQKLRGAAFWAEVCTPEYIEHEDGWIGMTLAEKKASAKKLKVTWEKHEDARVDNIRMTQAVRAELGIKKYKPEYESRAARAAIRG